MAQRTEKDTEKDDQDTDTGRARKSGTGQPQSDKRGQSGGTEKKGSTDRR